MDVFQCVSCSPFQQKQLHHHMIRRQSIKHPGNVQTTLQIANEQLLRKTTTFKGIATNIYKDDYLYFFPFNNINSIMKHVNLRNKMSQLLYVGLITSLDNL